MFKGKYGSLQFLKSLNINVPDFSVITHEEFVSNGDDVLLDALLSTLETNDFEMILMKARAFAESVDIPAEKLITKPGTYYAVRSSALLEDSPEHSFAGIFETKLFVATDIEAAIKEVWVSLFQPKALQYCLDRDLSWFDLKMDIILQEMINGEKSGVLFQADPMGKITEQLIVAGFGLGQGIVDEETDTDRYVIENFEIKENAIQEKRFYLTYDDKKIVKKELPASQRSISVLSQSEIEKLLTVSVIISTYTEHFMDVEFTFRGSELFILQARPITTLPSKKHIVIFDNSNIAENYPGFSTPLTYTGLARGYATNFKNLIRFVGLDDSDWAHLNNQLDQLVGYWGGQIYYNLNNWYSVYTLLPFGAEKAVQSFNEMVGINTDSIIKVPERSFFKKLQILFRILPKFLSFYFRAGGHHRRYKQQFRELHDQYQESIHQAKSSFEIISLIDRLDNDYLAIIKIPLFNDFFSSILNRLCRQLSKAIIPDKGEQLYNDLLSNREELESSKAIYSLIELAEIVQKNPELESYLTQTYKRDPRFKTFFDKLQTHFDRFGDRSQWEMKIEVPTARENPETTMKLILEYAKAGLSSEAQRTKEILKSENARKEFDKSTFKKPLLSFIFNRLFNKCTEALSFREDSRFDRVRFKGLSRKLILKLGIQLSDKKWLKDSEDIFYLTFDELRSLNYDSYGTGYWKELVELRKKHLEEFKHLRLPDRILTNDLTSVKKFSLSSEVSLSGAIRGIPCSGGMVETECEVVLDLNNAPSLAGKILVAERTDPAWGYFFVGVKGIIIEKGSMLSHAAIISRELGIPCIINVKNATQLLKSGMKVKMNGDTGEIEIVP